MPYFVEAADLNVAGIILPAFEVQAGDVVDVHWPGKYMGIEEKALGEFLAGGLPGTSSQVHVAACIAIPSRILSRRNFILRQPRLVDLREACALELLSSWDAFVRKFLCSEREKIASLALTPKVLFALLLGMSKSRFVVYSTAGLDPLGISRIEAFVGKSSDKGWAFLRCLNGRPEDGVRVVRW